MSEISKHITYREATFSATAARMGIDNTPTAQHLRNMFLIAEQVFEPLRAHVGGPIGITSFYRCAKLNKAVGGSANSQHCMGQAMDLDMDRIPGARATNAFLFHQIRGSLLFDQLIWEFGTDSFPDWVHVSLVADPSKNRRQVLRAVRSIGGRTSYKPWIAPSSRS